MKLQRDYFERTSSFFPRIRKGRASDNDPLAASFCLQLSQLSFSPLALTAGKIHLPESKDLFTNYSSRHTTNIRERERWK